MKKAVFFLLGLKVYILQIIVSHKIFIRHVVSTAHPDLMQCVLQKLVIIQHISQEETNISINCMFHQRFIATYRQMVLSKFSGITCVPDGSMFTNNVFPYNCDRDTGQTQS